MFFFIDSIKLHEFPMVKEAFNIVCKKRLEINFYCSMERFISIVVNRLEYRDKLRKMKSLIAGLYENAYPREEEQAREILRDLQEALAKQAATDRGYELSVEEAEAVVYWLYHVYGRVSLRKTVTKDSLPVLEEVLGVKNLDFAENILYVEDKVETNVIDGFSRFCEEIEWMEAQNHTFFFRGHSSAAYSLLPSIMRKTEWLIHENDMYNELRIECSNDFSECKTHLDYLVEMQHYGLPTRLLDVTQNPLVALYFACDNEPEKAGEFIVFDIANENIKYPGSDVVSILASLPLLSYTEKEGLLTMIKDPKISENKFNAKATCLLHEVKLEKPAFRDEIKKEDVSSAVFVLSEKKNKRIIKQDGAFIVCGLFGEEENPINDYRYRDAGKIQLYIITSKAKKKIKEQLEKFSINRATLFPEIEEVSCYIKEKYS